MGMKEDGMTEDRTTGEAEEEVGEVEGGEIGEEERDQQTMVSHRATKTSDTRMTLIKVTDHTVNVKTGQQVVKASTATVKGQIIPILMVIREEGDTVAMVTVIRFLK